MAVQRRPDVHRTGADSSPVSHEAAVFAVAALGRGHQPPATAGMMETPAPSGVGVSRPCSKRTSSSFT
jgi:hypothetical protein